MTDQEAEEILDRLKPTIMLSLETLAETFAAVVAGEKRIGVVTRIDRSGNELHELVLTDSPAVELRRAIPTEDEQEALRIKSIARKLRDDCGTEIAKEVIFRIGGPDAKLADIAARPELYDAFERACDAARAAAVGWDMVMSPP